MAKKPKANEAKATSVAGDIAGAQSTTAPVEANQALAQASDVDTGVANVAASVGSRNPANVPPVDGRALVVRSRSRKGFRRAGFAFTVEPSRPIPVRLLGRGEYDAIVNDPNLIVEIIAIDEGPVSAE